MTAKKEEETYTKCLVKAMAFEKRRERSSSESPKGTTFGRQKEFSAVLTNYSFDSLVRILGPSIQKNDTFMRKAITVEEKVSTTLRFLATGEKFSDLSYPYRAGERTISTVIKQITRAVYNVMKDSYLKTASTANEWKEVAKQFDERWNYPFCLGAIDGKHIAIRQPPNSGSQYFNYKHFFSIILMALVGADYRFLYVDAGAAGRCGDAGVFNQSLLKKYMDCNALNFPEGGTLPGDDKVCHYYIIGDDAFPLRNDIMKPFSHRSLEPSVKIFNYRLSRARRVVKNAVAILANRFRVFLTTISLDPEHVDYPVEHPAFCTIS